MGVAHRVTRIAVVCIALIASSAATTAAETFEVGDGMTYPEIDGVPWETLMPGDLVRIHWRAQPYKSKWVIGRSGTEAAPIVVQGVAGPGGELPVIDGRDATTRTELSFTNEERGVIKIGTSNVPDETLPAWIVIEKLDVRSARPPYNFTGDDGSGGSYAGNAASIYIERGENIVIRECIIRDSGNGLFIGAFNGDTQHIRVERNWLYDNGNEGSAFEHNSYTAAIDIVFEGNHYGPLRAGADGNNLKDRSAGLVVRYNWIESGNRQLDLVDAEDSAVLVGHPSYGETFVYGNVLVEHEGDGNSQIVHYGGDSGTEPDYRKGTLYFHNNTVLSTRDGNTTLLRLSTNAERADLRNNIVFATAGGDRLAMLSSSGVLDLRHNWFSPGWVDSHGALDGTINDDGTGLGGADPGFVGVASQDLHLVQGSTCIGGATALAAGALPDHAAVRQYVRHQSAEPRPTDGALDVGAYEYCAPDACTGASDAGVPVGGDDAGGGGGGGSGDAQGGCGCTIAGTGAGSSGAPLWLALGGLLAWKRRR
jgi:MYXO-CTERM domain-containing protein